MNTKQQKFLGFSALFATALIWGVAFVAQDMAAATPRKITPLIK